MTMPNWRGGCVSVPYPLTGVPGCCPPWLLGAWWLDCWWLQSAVKSCPGLCLGKVNDWPLAMLLESTGHFIAA